MANELRVLTGNGSGDWTIVMHFPVPDANNAAGINFRAALRDSGIGLNTDTGRRTVLPTGDGTGGTISTAEEALLDSGAVFEHVGSFSVESGGADPSDMQASIQQFYESENEMVQADIGSRLRYFGHTENAA